MTTEFTLDGLHQLPSETPRAYIARLRSYVVALLDTLAEDDPQRAVLQVTLDDVHAILDEAAGEAGYLFRQALAQQMQDPFVQTVKALDAPQQDALDKVIPADPAERAVVQEFVADLLGEGKPAPVQDAPPAEAPAPAVKAPPPRMRPNVPRRTENAAVQGSQTQDVLPGRGGDRVEGARGAGNGKAAAVGTATGNVVQGEVQERQVVPNPARAPVPRGPGAPGGRPANPARPVQQPAGAQTAGRPGSTGSSLSGLKKASAGAERAEEPAEAPAQPQRSGTKIYADGTVETERTMHIAGGKAIRKPTKTTFVVPPLDPDDHNIP